MGNKQQQQKTERTPDHLFKIYFIGDPCTGKTSLLSRIAGHPFPESYAPTIGADFRAKTVDLDGKVIKETIQDSSGQEKFKSVVTTYFKDAHIFVLVFDVTNLDSFENLRKWHQEVQNRASAGIKLLVVGNKIDLEDKRTVPYDTAMKYAEEIGAGYLEVSAKNLSNVDHLPQLLAEYGMSLSEAKKVKQDSQSETTGKNYDYLFKLLLVGEAGSGKSSILIRYGDNEFSDTYFPTLGVDFKVKMLNVNEKKVKVQIWDAAKIPTSYYQEAHGIALVYDITSKDSFNKLQSHLEKMKSHASKKVKLTVVGNKTDLESKREVSYDEGRGFAESIGAEYCEVSAKDDENIKELFTKMSSDLVDAH